MTTTVTSAPAAHFALIFRFNDNLMTRALDGVSDAELTTRITDQTNPILWVMAHAITTRASLLKQLGDAYETGWGARFSRGAALDLSDASLSRERVLEVHGEVGRRLQATLSTLTEEALSTSAAHLKIPMVNTLADALAFFCLHDSYHVGQMAFIRKALGHSQLVG